MRTGVAAVTLTEFLLARIAEDEKWARQRRDEDFVKHRVGRRPHLAPDDAERVLRQCAAGRRIVELHSGDEDPNDCPPWGRHPDGSEPCWTLIALASVYADHPDYRGEWKL